MEILLGVIGILILIAVFMYNRLITLRNSVKNAWSGIETQLQRRYDLIPNLVETVKGYMAHEREVLESVTKARTAFLNADSVKETAQAENMMAGALKTLFAVSENYPELKASQNFLMLQEELAGTENKVSYARQRYNNSVMDYNTAIQKFPANLFAGMFGFKETDFFEVENVEARQAVKVKF
ncbi:LemA family protein [Desulfitibacter alkalitolerans]|uniref:LemA family protein n=1 Tax=Desulfitibacter alkalitolerans TaxID=264641 RepID=UPI00054D4F70|nr:LemA family protein [Desulfitibacter alkalitolerans]